MYVCTHMFYMWQTWIVCVYTHVHTLMNAPMPSESPVELSWRPLSSPEESVGPSAVALPTCLVSEALLQKRCRTFVACATVSAVDCLCLHLGPWTWAPSGSTNSAWAMPALALLCLLLQPLKVFLNLLLPLLWAQWSVKFSMSVGCLVSVVWKATD